MGSSALYHLARRGADVVGVEQFEPGHVRGSSHGHSRVFRTTYDDPLYVELAREALGMWRQLEAEADVQLLELCGLLIFASLDNDRFTATLQMLEDARLPHDRLDPAAVAKRFPTFQLNTLQHAFFAQENGFLRADRVLETLKLLAEAHGARRWHGCRVESIESTAEGVRVIAGEQTIEAGRVVITAGAWLDRLAEDLNWQLEVTREEKIYLRAKDPTRVVPDHFPCFCEYDTSNYGFPTLDGQTIKVAADHVGPRVDPDSVDRDVDDAAVRQLYEWVQRWQPGLVEPGGRGEVCLYTNTPDRDFLIGVHPSDERVVLAGGFSGHGFKFSVLVGDILADLVLDGATRRRIDRFAVDRFL
jgi:monomeric sarcosine oxidase